MKFRFVIFLAVSLLCLSISPPVYPWTESVHTITGYEAFAIVFQKFNHQYFPDDYFIDDVSIGTIEPDENRVRSHIKVYECAVGVKYSAKKAEKMIQKHKKWSDIVLKMSQAAHYIQDQNCPHHSIGRYIQGDHERFERRAIRGFWEDNKFDGFQYVENYTTFTYNAVRFSKRYFQFENKITETEYYRSIMEPLWDHTVNDVIDLWLTILYKGLGEEPYNEYGFPPRIVTRAEKKIKYPKIENLDIEE